MPTNTAPLLLLSTVALALAEPTLALTGSDLALTPQEVQRLHTSRADARKLVLPKEDDAFGFVIFGDRTGGPDEGIQVLIDAVDDTNLLDPDLVMTVGDLVQGYNNAEQWLAQTAEFRQVMSKLRMPWFPVAGNHDIYWRGANRPTNEHEGRFEEHFGPLWYAFDHKDCRFIILYTDEPAPGTDKRAYTQPECQKISEEQFGWLKSALEGAQDARHIFVFAHHPRWLKDRYKGSDWDRVHEILAANGNVRAVFAGHIHRMRYDGKRDGIDYYTLAATGGRLEFDLLGAGYLHEFHVVTVRPDDITIATLPVGAVIDPQQITGQVSEDVDRLVEKFKPKNIGGLKFTPEGGVLGTLRCSLTNPVNRPIEVTVSASGDESWTFTPDHTHATLAAKETRTFELHARRRTDLGTSPQLPLLAVDCDYLAENLRLSIPRVERKVQMPAPAGLLQICEAAEPDAAPQRALQLSAPASCGRIPASAIELPDGPLTVEAWLRGSSFSGKRKIVSKAQEGEFHLTANDGAVSFMLYLDGSYRGATTNAILKPGGWHHVAGVFDGQEVRIYVDGRLLARNPAEGSRKTNAVALLVGAEPDAKSKPTAGFAGQLAEVRISSTARYAGDAFEPPTRHEPDPHCQLLLRCQQDAGSWILDSSKHARHAVPVGQARLMLRQ